MQTALHKESFANLDEALVWAADEIAKDKKAEAEAAARIAHERNQSRKEVAAHIIEALAYRGELGPTRWHTRAAGGYWRDACPEEKQGEAWVAQNQHDAWVASVRPLVEFEAPVYVGTYHAAEDAIAAVLRVDDEGGPQIVGWEKISSREFHRRLSSGTWYVKQANSGLWYFGQLDGDISDFYQTAEQAMGVAEATANR